MAINKKVFLEDANHLEKILEMLDENSDNLAYFIFFWLAKSVYDIINYILAKEN